MRYIVMCNDHANAVHHINRFMEAHPDATTIRSMMTIRYAGDEYYFFNKQSGTDHILSQHFDGMIIPPGYKWFDNVEIVALSKVRYNHVSNHSSGTSANT